MSPGNSWKSTGNQTCWSVRDRVARLKLWLTLDFTHFVTIFRSLQIILCCVYAVCFTSHVLTWCLWYETSMVHSRDSTIVTRYRWILFYHTDSIAFTYSAAAGHLSCRIFHQSKLKRVELCMWDWRSHWELILVHCWCCFFSQTGSCSRGGTDHPDWGGGDAGD